MKGLGLCFTVLALFVYIILCSVIFLFFSRKKEAMNKKIIRELKRTFGVEILQHLETIKSGNEINYEDTLGIKSHLNDTLHEQVFNETIILFNKDKSNRKYTREYMKNFQKYINGLISKKQAEDERAYTAFLLGEYKLNTEKVNEFLLDCLKSNSLHLRFNSLRSLSRIGNPHCFIKGLNIISEKEINFNIKIILDIFDEFGGNLEKLYLVTISEFDILGEKTQLFFIEHLVNKKKNLMNEKLLSLLNEKDVYSEIKSSIIKYFGIIKYERSKETLLRILKDEIWECRAVSANSLQNYRGDDVIDALVESIRDENWYVRLNSARTLLKLNVNSEIIFGILNSDDKYSREIMKYALEMQHN